MISKTIFTIWFTESLEHKKNFRPELIQKCLDSQKIEGYTHHIITLDNVDRTSQYVREALANKNWVKAADYVRMQYLYKNGGIHLDADMEILPNKNFDDLLDCTMFTSLEVAGMYSNAGVGAIKGHPVIKQYLDRVDKNYKGTGELVFEPGIRTWHDICWAANKKLFNMIAVDYFHPYNHLTNEVNVTANTRVYHHFAKSWVTPEFKAIQKTEQEAMTLNQDNVKEVVDTSITKLEQCKESKDSPIVVVPTEEKTQPRKKRKYVRKVKTKAKK